MKIIKRTIFILFAAILILYVSSTDKVLAKTEGISMDVNIKGSKTVSSIDVIVTIPEKIQEYHFYMFIHRYFFSDDVEDTKNGSDGLWVEIDENDELYKNNINLKNLLKKGKVTYTVEDNKLTIHRGGWDCERFGKVFKVEVTDINGKTYKANSEEYFVENYTRPHEHKKLVNEQPSQTELKNKEIVITTATVKNASKVHNYLIKGKKLTLKIKGDKKAARKTFSELTEIIRHVNSYSIAPLLENEKEDIKQMGSYTYYTISSNRAKIYKYTLQLIKKAYKYCIKVYPSFFKNVNFCDMSQYMQVELITGVAGIYINGSENGFGMSYSYGHNMSWNDVFFCKSKVFKQMLDGSAYGTCSFQAKMCVYINEQLGCESAYIVHKGANHAWAMSKMKNINGKNLFLSIDDIVESFYNSKYYNYSLRKCGIKGAPKKWNYKLKDFKEFVMLG